jgi:tetratricopeptide (TPR) repeat protein
MPKTSSYIRFLTIVVLMAGAAQAETAATRTYAIQHVNVLPMNKPGVLRDQTVVVEAGKVAATGSAASVKVPAGAQVIDGRGKFLMPGLTDTHVHLLSPTELPLYLASGVTTVYNMDGRGAHLLWRKQVQEDKLAGPSVSSCGPIFGRRRKPEDDIKLVDAQAVAGYDCVKLMERVSRAEFPELMEEAKKQKMAAVGHVPREVGLEGAVAGGQSMAHAWEYVYTYFNPQHDDKEEHVVLDEKRLPEVARLTAKAGVFVMPTLVTYRAIVEERKSLPDFLRRPELAQLAPWVREGLEAPQNFFYNQYRAEDVPRLESFLTFQRKLVKALLDAGVPLLAGTDSTDIGPVAGVSLHQELQELVTSGLTPWQALQTATVNAARFLHHENEFGDVAAGQRADLLLLDANPLEDIRHTQQIRGVMLRGEWHEAGDLARWREQVKAGFERDLTRAQAMLAGDPAAAQAFFQENDPFDRLLGAALRETARKRGADALLELLRGIHERQVNSRFVSEAFINQLGYTLLKTDQKPAGVAVLRLNTELYPSSANTYDSLGEALVGAGDTEHATDLYRKALEVNPNYVNAAFARKFVEEHGRQ